MNVFATFLKLFLLFWLAMFDIPIWIIKGTFFGACRFLKKILIRVVKTLDCLAPPEALQFMGPNFHVEGGGTTSPRDVTNILKDGIDRTELILTDFQQQPSTRYLRYTPIKYSLPSGPVSVMLLWNYPGLINSKFLVICTIFFF
jgi:hypothetical protein